MTSFDRPDRDVDRVFIHCSASDQPAHDSVDVIRDWHLARKWSDIGYHFVITKDGTVHPGRGAERTPAAQRGNNRGTIAICVTGLDCFSLEQLDSLRYLADEIDLAYPGEDGVTYHGHCEVSAKECPVFNYRRVLGLDVNGGRSA